MRDIGGNVSEIAGASLVNELQTISPADAGPPANDVNHCFHFTVVVRSGFGVGVDDHRSGPELLRTHAGVGDGFGTSHSWSLRRVGVQFAAAHDAHAMIFPVRLAF